MHEYSIVAALVEQVGQQVAAHGAESVRRVVVSIGELSGVDAGLLASAYDVFREKTICDGAELEIRRVDASWACGSCGRRIERGAILRCTECGSPARLEAGDEIFLERIEMEVA